jgi:hypothetical protein
VYPGEFVTLASDGQVDTAAAAGDIYGLALHYATVGQKILLSVDPSQLYIGQWDGVGVAAQTSVGQTADIVATAGNTTYKWARMQVDTSSVGSSQQLVLHSLVQAPDNAFGTSPKMIMSINQHQIFGTDDFTSI